MFGLPPSLSDSYYYFDEYKKNLGWVFTGMMFLTSILLMPAWISITETISPWSHYLQALPFLGAASIAFVGAAPQFKPFNRMENKVHMTAAACAAIFSLLWVAIVCYKLAWMIPAWILLIGAIAHLTKTAKSKRDYWLEMVAFGATLTTIVVECILNVL